MLPTLQIRSAKRAERAFKLADTGGLFLLVQPNGSKLRRSTFRLNGVEGMRAIGALPEVALADVRHARAESRKLVAHPLELALRELRDLRGFGFEP